MQPLKSMLCRYCFGTGNREDESIPNVLFALREAEKGLLGFVPPHPVCGHDV